VKSIFSRSLRKNNAEELYQLHKAGSEVMPEKLSSAELSYGHIFSEHTDITLTGFYNKAEVLDFKVHVSTPPGYEIQPELVGKIDPARFKVFADPMDACRGADLVTTDVWTSMGFEAENEERIKAFADWCVDGDMMRVADPQAVFMHCLPAHRGEEVTAEVIDGPQSVVWDEAENRLHVQKALMEYLLLGRIQG
jgi:ornithine carbamoyltransferase